MMTHAPRLLASTSEQTSQAHNGRPMTNDDNRKTTDDDRRRSTATDDDRRPATSLAESKMHVSRALGRPRRPDSPQTHPTRAAVCDGRASTGRGARERGPERGEHRVSECRSLKDSLDSTWRGSDSDEHGFRRHERTGWWKADSDFPQRTVLWQSVTPQGALRGARLCDERPQAGVCGSAVTTDWTNPYGGGASRVATQDWLTARWGNEVVCCSNQSSVLARPWVVQTFAKSVRQVQIRIEFVLLSHDA